MKKKTLRMLLPCLLLALVVALSITSLVLGKYATTVTAGSGAIQVDARLASTLQVLESQAQRLDTGEYGLSQTETVTGNTYILLPGVDIPKDPRVVITGKTQVPAYLYLTVTCQNEALTYDLLPHWVQVGQSDTYVYSDANGDPVALTQNPEPIYVFVDNTVQVSSELLAASQPEAAITITAELKEVTG